MSSSYHLLSILIFHLITFQTHALRPPQQQPRPPPRHNPNNPTTPVPASSVCQSTQYPTYCNKILHSNNTTTTTATLYEYGRFSMKRSISQTAKFLRLINHYLHKRHRTLTPSAVGALQDCQLLTNLNLDFLTTSFYSLKQNKTLHHNTSDDIQTYLSGTLTNQQTCIDGIKSAESAWSIDHDITKLFSISLSLFTKAWSPPPPPNPKIPSTTHHGRLPRLHHRHRHGRLLSGDGGYNDDENDVAVAIYDVVTVAQDGSGNFSSIMEAVNAAPDKNEANDGYFLIYVSEGVYEEYVDVDKKKRYIMMIGDGINKTIITGNRSVAHNFTTFHSATFVVTGTGFVGVNITIRNTAGAANHQAVALRSSSDLSAFYSCSFEGYQDTLYVHSLRQFYKECDIYGTVDFIFGNANVVFQNCNIYPRLPLENQFNAITAQGRTDPNQNTGISIENCVIRASDDLSKSNGTIKTYLGRPWKEYSRTVYMKSFIDNVVDSSGWREWNGNFALDTLYYGEYNNRGPSSNVSNRVNWGGYHVMNATDASNFTVASFVFGDDWLPQTGVPYASDLL